MILMSGYRTVLVRKEIYDLIERLARAESRSRSDMVEQAVKFYAMRKHKPLWLSWLEVAEKGESVPAVYTAPYST